MTDVKSPLGREHLSLINQTLAKLHDVQELVAKLERCGTPCADLEEQRQYLIQILTNFKREFFPESITGPPHG
jgi:enoyl reductase-like protein